MADCVLFRTKFLALTIVVITVCCLFSSCGDTGACDFAAEDMSLIASDDIVEAYICSGAVQTELTEEDLNNLINALHTVQADQFRDKSLRSTENSLMIKLADGDIWSITMLNSEKYVSVTMNDHAFTGVALKSSVLYEMIAELLKQTQ